MNEKLVELFKNESFCSEFFDAIEDMSALNTLLNSNGIAIGENEIKELVMVVKQQMSNANSDELDADALDNVTGGLIGWVVAGVASAAFFGYQTYKNTKAIKDTICK